MYDGQDVEGFCDGCSENDVLVYNAYCSATVCCKCNKHQTLTRCWCGWSESGGDGRKELEEMGETIGDEIEFTLEEGESFEMDLPYGHGSDYDDRMEERRQMGFSDF